MTPEEIVILVRVLAALVVGASIGFESTFHGRPAGFRTHSLVCLASSLLMLVTVYQNQWMTIVPLDAIRTDPTRMAQGIMTAPSRPLPCSRRFDSSTDASPPSSTRTIPSPSRATR